MPRQRLTLTEDQAMDLQARVATASSSAERFRAQLILELAAGSTYADIMRRLSTTAPTISKWKKRYVEFGVEGLGSRREKRGPRVATEPVQRRILELFERNGVAGERWSCRAIARVVGVSKATVQRVWAKARTAAIPAAAAAGADQTPPGDKPPAPHPRAEQPQ
jgi:transposase